MSEDIHHHPEPSFLKVTSGIKNWLVTVDHKRIGVMYLFGILGALLLGGAFALLVRIELFKTGHTIVDEDTYNKFFTLHGAVMVFLVIVPGIPAALGNIVLPMQLGAPDVAFPRLNLASFYLWCIGAMLMLATVILGGVDTGWTFYVPYSLDAVHAITALLGVFILGFSSIFTGLNFVVTVHKFRSQGMGWFKMPLNIWALYSTAVIQVLATPVIGITVLLLFVEKFMGIGIFDPNLGGDPVLFQHFFWFYSHPAVYIMIIPAMGVMSELMSTFSRKPIFGYRFIAYSSLALALLSFLVWGHHMFVSGQSRLATMVFSALTFTVGIPSAIKVFNWTATLYKGSIHLTTPMLYALSFILLFTIGGLTGLFLGILSVDVHLHDTYFVVAHFHYVMMGSTLIAFLGGIHYWFPKFSGRMYPERLAQFLAVIIFLGFNLTFLPQFVMGSRGMPRRYWDYDPRFELYHQLSTIGAMIMGFAIFGVVLYLIWAAKRGRKAPANPWGSSTLEWQQQSPPPLYNFSRPPKLRPLYDYTEIVAAPDGGYMYPDQTDLHPTAIPAKSVQEEGSPPARPDKEDARKTAIVDTASLASEVTAAPKSATGLSGQVDDKPPMAETSPIVEGEAEAKLAPTLSEESATTEASGEAEPDTNQEDEEQ